MLIYSAKPLLRFVTAADTNVNLFRQETYSSRTNSIYTVVALVDRPASGPVAFYTTAVRVYSRRFLLLPLLCVLAADVFCSCHCCVLLQPRIHMLIYSAKRHTAVGQIQSTQL